MSPPFAMNSDQKTIFTDPLIAPTKSFPNENEKSFAGSIVSMPDDEPEVRMPTDPPSDA